MIKHRIFLSDYATEGHSWDLKLNFRLHKGDIIDSDIFQNEEFCTYSGFKSESDISDEILNIEVFEVEGIEINGSGEIEVLISKILSTGEVGAA